MPVSRTYFVKVVPVSGHLGKAIGSARRKADALAMARKARRGLIERGGGVVSIECSEPGSDGKTRSVIWEWFESPQEGGSVVVGRRLAGSQQRSDGM